MIHYTFATVLFSQIRGGDLDFELGEMIRSGQLSNYLLRPVGIVEFVYLRGLAPKLFLSSVSLLAGCVVGAWFGIDPLRMVGALLLALLGNVIHFQIGAALATISFFWEEAYSVLMVKNMIVSILSGELLPLTLFPASLQWLWKSTPFYLCVFGPAQYALGHWSHLELARQLGIASLWVLGGWALVRLSWSSGIRRYTSLGG
jgi:ABC-2 type transport system permease protein